MGSARGHFRPMSNEHVSTWTASVHTVNVTVLPHCCSACVYIVHGVKKVFVTILLNLDVVVSNVLRSWSCRV